MKEEYQMEPETLELLKRTIRVWLVWIALFVGNTLALNALFDAIL